MSNSTVDQDVELLPSPQQIKELTLALVGCFIGMCLYGAYTVLFVVSSVGPSFDALAGYIYSERQIFFYSSISMFISITLFVIFTIRRYSHALITYTFTTGQFPKTYLHDWGQWDNWIVTFFLGFVVWLGDGLAVYRCYLIWDKNFIVIAIPSALLLTSINLVKLYLTPPRVSNSVNLAAFLNPSLVPENVVLNNLRMVYPVNIAQTTLTTSLITWKIYAQYRISKEAGLHDMGSKVNSLTIIRVVVESAMIFTVQQIILCATFYAGNPAGAIFHGTLVPSIGIVFLLISNRCYEAQIALENSSNWELERISALNWPESWGIPTTLPNPELGPNRSPPRDSASAGATLTFRQRQAEDLRFVGIPTGTDESKSDVELHDLGEGSLKLRRSSS
ncbi:hypothetical protein CC1G_09608 [Coprinopsis cinerea okayama7|uniref:Uncharacterized protein n=1 Tax=Coprinopsis cinerea (strain Okayama-7 / 130 / ATCC MYA-4618 / FGSC 9003) TaxID=240176 RepID=A8N4C4_COPC7|nr:hypothetical protein CC1G_09608 [Coprinopsis cinerea okayama7\|eukprot:XP_001829719.2 hypothetical protein CC1G_09608 [Coprinopsis cinerea okayama7\